MIYGEARGIMIIFITNIKMTNVLFSLNYTTDDRYASCASDDLKTPLSVGSNLKHEFHHLDSYNHFDLCLFTFCNLMADSLSFVYSMSMIGHEPLGGL